MYVDKTLFLDFSIFCPQGNDLPFLRENGPCFCGSSCVTYLFDGLDVRGRGCDRQASRRSRAGGGRAKGHGVGRHGEGAGAASVVVRDGHPPTSFASPLQWRLLVDDGEAGDRVT